MLRTCTRSWHVLHVCVLVTTQLFCLLFPLLPFLPFLQTFPTRLSCSSSGGWSSSFIAFVLIVWLLFLFPCFYSNCCCIISRYLQFLQLFRNIILPGVSEREREREGGREGGRVGREGGRGCILYVVSVSSHLCTVIHVHVQYVMYECIYVHMYRGIASTQGKSSRN